jgi:hypothetical protein
MNHSKSVVRVGLPALLALACLQVACASADDDAANDGTEVSSASNELSASVPDDVDFQPFKAPSNWPRVWNQPNSGGWFGAKGRCGATSLANYYMLMPTQYRGGSPQTFINQGADDFIGTFPMTMTRIISGLGETDRFTQCGGYSFGSTAASAWSKMNAQLSQNKPFIALIDMTGNTLHYVTVVGATRTKVILMNWGSYQQIDKDKFMAGWAHPLGQPFPVWYCNDVPASYSLYSSR